jgi:hypothetical protein
MDVRFAATCYQFRGVAGRHAHERPFGIERDPDIAAMYSKLQDGYSAPLQSIIQRAMQKGELPKTEDVALLVAALTGPLFYRRWFSPGTPDERLRRELKQEQQRGTTL